MMLTQATANIISSIGYFHCCQGTNIRLDKTHSLESLESLFCHHHFFFARQPIFLEFDIEMVEWC